MPGGKFELGCAAEEPHAISEMAGSSRVLRDRSFTGRRSVAVAGSGGPIAEGPNPHLLPWSQQIAVREGWLVKRQALLLDMMRRHNVEMWIVVNEEFHDDPLTEFVAPPRPYTGNRDFFVFVDAGDKGLKKIAVTGYSQESVAKFFEKSNVPQPDIPSELHALWDTYHPAHIALGIDGKRGVTRSLPRNPATNTSPKAWAPKLPSNLSLLNH